MPIVYNTDIPLGVKMLEKLLGSKTRARLLNLFFGLDAGEYYLRQLEKKTNLAIRNIQKEIIKLKELDLIVERISGNRKYYQANKSHPISEEIHRIILKTIGLVDIFNKSLSSPKIKIAFVFGSIAKNEEKAQSDIDLMIIGNISTRDVVKLLRPCREKLNREINPHILSDAEFKQKKNSHFIKTILNSKKLFVIGNSDDLEKLGK